MIYDSLLRPFNLEGINENCMVSFKPIDKDKWYTGNIKWIYSPNSKYNKTDYWTFEVVIILPIYHQWSKDGDKTVYYGIEIEEMIVLDNTK